VSRVVDALMAGRPLTDFCGRFDSDGNIRYYEYVDEAPFLHFLSEYKSSEPQRGLAFLPKTALNIAECEIARAFKVHPFLVEPISFKVPRKVSVKMIRTSLVQESPC
jgi:hypothetical protein